MKLKPQKLNWRPITEAPDDEACIALFLYADAFIDEDSNPSGIVDGCWDEYDGWTMWQWDGCRNRYNTIRGAKPTHFAIKRKPKKE